MRIRLRFLVLASLVFAPCLLRGHQSDTSFDQTRTSVPSTQKSTPAAGNQSLDQTMEAGESDEA